MDAKYIRLANQMNGLGDDDSGKMTGQDWVNAGLNVLDWAAKMWGNNANSGTTTPNSGSTTPQTIYYVTSPASSGANTNNNTSSETKSDNTVLYLALGACVACAAMFAFSRRR